MSVAQTRGGVPHVLRATVDNTDGRKHRLPANCSYLKIRVTTNPCKLYFTEADRTADANYVLVPVPAAETPYGEWEGPVESPASPAPAIWLLGDGGNSVVELVTFQRRG